MAEVSLAHSYPELFRVTGPPSSLVVRAEDMWQRYNQCLEVGGALNQGFPFSPLMSHFRDLPDALEYKFLGCIQDHHQSQMASNGIAMAGQDSDGGGRHRENVYVECRVYVVVLALGDLVVRRRFP